MKSLFLRSTLLGSLVLLPTLASAGDLKPHAEVNFRAGTERSILMTEFWAPLAQQSDRVLYGDLRLMGDGDDNREGNLGFGYRQISPKTNSVLGANAWIDRRRTENGNHFHQLTLGIESLGDTIDLRANGYIQLNSSKTRITPNIGSTNPYLTGTGIFFDTNGFIVEEPQDGFDTEIGYRLPVLQKHIDATRVYAGGYHFWGDTTDNVTGFRLRTEAQVNSILSVGARFQHDGPRGSQGFLEATLRFPFKSKKLYQEHGLRSRLDESPERDIDIVTGAKVDTGLMKPVINSRGVEQRILYVDNTNTNTGDGSKDNPFNTLKAAEAALQNNDILYINHGDGTTTGMDKGIVVNKADVQLIGSGSNLTYNGFTLISAGLAPTITNTQSTVDTFTGNGVLVTANNFSISGLTISGNARSGINARIDGQSSDYLNIDNVTVSNNGIIGIAVKPINGGTIDTVSISNTTATMNGIIGSAGGINVSTETSGTINNINISNITSNSNTGQGITFLSDNGKIGKANISSVTANNNTLSGLTASTSNSGVWNMMLLDQISTSSNQGNGVAIQSATGGTITYARATNVTASNNLANGITVTANNNGTILNQVELSNIASFNNTSSGVNISNSATGVIGSVSVKDSVSNNNAQQGFYANASALMGSVSFSGLTANNNLQRGINISTNSSAGIINQATITTSSVHNNLDGILVNAANGQIKNVTASNISTTGNRHGFYMVSQTSGVINNVTLSSITANNNTQNGLYVFALNTSGGMNNISVSSSTMTGNTINGIYLQNQAAANLYSVDLGGGSMSSTGQNRSLNNGSKEIQIAFANPSAVFAQSNWWGNASGLLAGRMTVSAGSTITTTGFLTTDPRP